MVFWGYKLEEASRASAILHTFPVFVAVLAVLTLGESLIPGQWAAILSIVTGAFVISIRRHVGPHTLSISRAFPILIIASLLTALSHVFAKAALDDGLTIWMTYAIRSTAMAMAFGFLAKPQGFIEMTSLLGNGRTLVLMLIADFTMAPVASISLTRATEMGAISLVAALAATRPFFVFLYGSILSLPPLRLLDESIDIRNLATKTVSIFLITGGIALLSFG